MWLQFCKDGKYDLDFKSEDSKPEDYLTSQQLTDLYKSFVDEYPSMLTMYWALLVVLITLSL
jgi:hypothetical protein